MQSMPRPLLGSGLKRNMSFRMDERVIRYLRALAKRRNQSMAIVVEDAICAAGGRAPIKRRPSPTKIKATPTPKRKAKPTPKAKTKRSTH